MPRAENQTGGDFVATDWENADDVCKGSSLAHGVESDLVRTDLKNTRNSYGFRTCGFERVQDYGREIVKVEKSRGISSLGAGRQHSSTAMFESQTRRESQSTSNARTPESVQRYNQVGSHPSP